MGTATLLNSSRTTDTKYCHVPIDGTFTITYDLHSGVRQRTQKSYTVNAGICFPNFILYEVDSTFYMLLMVILALFVFVFKQSRIMKPPDNWGYCFTSTCFTKSNLTAAQLTTVSLCAFPLPLVIKTTAAYQKQPFARWTSLWNTPCSPKVWVSDGTRAQATHASHIGYQQENNCYLVVCFREQNKSSKCANEKNDGKCTYTGPAEKEFEHVY